MNLSAKMKGWETFRDAGLLWWVNRILHTFGWAIVIAEEDDGSVLMAWPERYEAFGFPREVDEEKLDQFRDHIERITVLSEDRLRAERDKLRNEVVALRGEQGHDYEPVEDQPLGERRRFVCTRCGHESEAPAHPYFGGAAVCPGS